MLIRIADYPNDQGAKVDAQRLRADVACALLAESSDVDITFQQDHLVASVRGQKTIPIAFVDEADEKRLIGQFANPPKAIGPLTSAAQAPGPAIPTSHPVPNPVPIRVLPPDNPVVAKTVDLVQKGLKSVAESQQGNAPLESNVTIPISATVVDTGTVSITGSATGTVGISNGLELGYKGVGVAAKQKVTDDITTSQQVQHTGDDGVVKYGAGLQVGGTSLGMAQGVQVGEKALSDTSFSIGQTFGGERVNCHVGLQQTFDGGWKAINPGFNANVGVKLDKNIRMNWQNQLTSPSFEATPKVTSMLTVNIDL